jgi:hypothetical protein
MEAYIVCIHFISIGFLCKLDLSLVSLLEKRGATVFQGYDSLFFRLNSGTCATSSSFFPFYIVHGSLGSPLFISNWRDLDHRPSPQLHLGLYPSGSTCTAAASRVPSAAPLVFSQQKTIAEKISLLCDV